LGHLAVERHHAVLDAHVHRSRRCSGSWPQHCPIVAVQHSQRAVRQGGFTHDGIGGAIADHGIGHGHCGNHVQSIHDSFDTRRPRCGQQAKALRGDVLDLTLDQQSAALQLELQRMPPQIDSGAREGLAYRFEDRFHAALANNRNQCAGRLGIRRIRFGAAAWRIDAH